MGQIQVGTNGYGTFVNQCTVSTSPCPSDKNQDQFTSINELLSLQAFIGDVVYTETDPSKQDTVTVNPDFTLSYTRNGSDKTKNNIQQFTIYLVGGTQQKKTQIILK
ncbi:hypothetical protein [Paenibacillus hexagrammi]|uniref:Uncharacterized protein n=1 Tax=Paenibacillus hexagrammi TaxID=2908839 RepID=A0ABY3SP24_9BACL|nr:hypothetical protein [Paenibacillus sp. YPD9-1]UJF35582.1 hypothetical protein L0M14_11065 [Paenibacillus sp. YPD9-1]